ncbi:TetR/AcrR family transcriptional regulator [Rathayibacter oskolensis]|uniref:TetR/AcrR family transcriptional regulator n=1 Tax=Rathayibacter oskolensis TaxID=1891671 RepID=UPI00265FFCBB|nr:TetR/AcrR family transcriptional regulator [Rathayibacter oskolensis]WKK70997.1 TetR/AcrR family transcriptional regulator [Rathayibacter oskolensis]
MPPAPARDRVLDAFEALLIEQGERAATLDATARTAGVSKGGLLYHFPSKDALVDGLVERLDERLAEDIDRIMTSDEGVVPYLIRTSFAADTPSTARSSRSRASPRATTSARAPASPGSTTAGTPSSPRPSATSIARAIVLMSDGLYYNSALLPTDDGPRGQAEDVLAVIDRLLQR